MASALAPEDYIYQGVWINWLKGGKVFGATLTVSPSTASILSPALALIVSIAGSQLWRLFQFALHQSRATKQERNFLYHQQQITLRNSSTDINTLWRLVRLAVAWRRHPDIKVCWQSLPLVIWTSFHVTLVIMAGLFSSWLLQAGDHVLSRSPWCGRYDSTFLRIAYSGDLESHDAMSAAFEYANHANSRFAVVQQRIAICDDSVHGCSTTSINKLPYTSNVVSDRCPFGSSVCHPNNESIVFDTGYLSSATHLGFNVAPHDRISFRLVAECAPLDDAKYVTDWKLVNGTSGLPAHQVSDANYGPAASAVRNATFSYTKQYTECEQRALLPPYILNSELRQAGANGASTFDPIPELQLTDADLSLIMLMVNSIYDSPVSDPWFTAQLAADEVDVYCLNGNKTMYGRETPLTTMGCKQQWQFCTTDSRSKTDGARCTKLQGIKQMSETFATPEKLTTPYTPNQLATVGRIIQAAKQSSFFYLVHALGQTNGAPIKARGLISGTSGISPPETQWQTETKYWMDILLAYLQQNLMDFSTGQFSFETRYINVTTPAWDPTGSAYSLCQNQLIRSTVYRNFNFFALLLCVILCTIITILGLTIEDMIGYFRQHRLRDSANQDKKDMWMINSDLEMLRTLIELKKKIPWSRSPFGIPIAPVGARAGIEDLKSDVLEAKAGHGIINKNVERRQTAMTIALSHEKRRAHSHGMHSGHKACATCESFEELSSSNDNLPGRTSPAKASVQRDQPRDFHFVNDIPTQTAQSGVPLLHAAQLPQQTQTPRVNGYEVAQPQISTDSFDGQQDSGHSTPMRTYDDNDRSRYGVIFTDDHGQNRVGDSDDNRVGRAGSIWPWSRRDDNSGTIC